MKKIAIRFTVCIMIVFLSGCSKEKESPYEEIAGRWMISSETTVTGNPPYSPFFNFGIFANSSSDVILHEDKTYTPLVRQGSAFIPQPNGSYEYEPALKKITLKLGLLEFDYTVSYFSGDDLWLEWKSHVYKFKRER